jgi:hypothetical protein
VTEPLESPDKLTADLALAAAALAALPDGAAHAAAVEHAAALITMLNRSLEATCHLAEKAAAVPDWVADFLNRRTEVEIILRLPVNTRKRNQQHGRDDPMPALLTPERMWEMANRLSVPSEFAALSKATEPQEPDHG